MSARDTRTVEERLARTKAILVAMQCVAIAVDDCVGDIATTTVWLYMMAAEEMSRLQSGLTAEVMNRDC